MDGLKLYDKQKALVIITNLIHDPHNVAQAIKEDIVGVLLTFANSDDLLSREKSTECFEIISRSAIGRASILESNSLEKLLHHIDDSSSLVRLNIAQVYSRIASVKAGAQHLLKISAFKKMMTNVEKERMDIQVYLLESCKECIRLCENGSMPKAALELDALNLFGNLAKNSLVSQVKIAACESIMTLWYIDFK
jgi:hypothetical protein